MSVSNLFQNSRCYLCNLRSRKNNSLRRIIRRYSDAGTDEIIIPKRIHRGPTDILKALASTIRRDPTAPHYKYHDDPYLIPTSNLAKRTYALSQESGRKAAMWVKQQHPELFQHIEADPPIKAFLGKPMYDEFDEVDEMTLLETMKTASVDDSIQVYELMMKTNAPISEDMKICLLELICFFNGEDQLAEELIEERWFSQTLHEQKPLKKTWKDGGYAEKLFSELSPNARTYSAIIMGMVKYLQLQKAQVYYQEALSKGLSLSVDTHNAMIKVTNYVKESWEERWKFIESILTTMNEYGCKPNVGTLNRILDVLVRNPSVRTESLALKMIAEVKKFGVEPSLGTYSILLNIYCKAGQQKTNISFILEDILDIIEEKKFTVQDVNDTLFFTNAMDKCRFYYNNSDIAFRVNQILWKNDNYNFIGNSFKESTYYRNFFCILCRNENLETIMDQYNFFVPNIYSPEMSVMNEIINAVTRNGAVELFAKLWYDIRILELSDKNSIVENLLKGMVYNRVPPTTSPSEMAVTLAETAYSIFSKVEKDGESTRFIVVTWTGEMLGDILLLILSANDFEKSKEVFKKLVTDQDKIVGTPSPESMEMLLDSCIKEKDVKFAMAIIDYCHNKAYIEDKKYARKLIQGTHINPMYASHLGAMFGQDILKEDPEDKKDVLKV